MLLTKILPHPYKKGFFKLYFDGKYSCTAHKETLLELKLKIGSRLDDISGLLSAEKPRNAFDYAALLLSYGDRSEKELQKRLRLKKYDAGLISRTIEKLKRLGFVDDEKFAGRFIGNRLRSGRGINLIRQELYGKGIDKDIVKRELEKLKPSPEDEYARAKELFDKKLKACGKLPDNKVYSRLGGYLARRGFTPGTINRVLGAWKDKFRELQDE